MVISEKKQPMAASKQKNQILKIKIGKHRKTRMNEIEIVIDCDYTFTAFTGDDTILSIGIVIVTFLF